MEKNKHLLDSLIFTMQNLPTERHCKDIITKTKSCFKLIISNIKEYNKSHYINFEVNLKNLEFELNSTEDVKEHEFLCFLAQKNLLANVILLIKELKIKECEDLIKETINELKED